MSILRLLIPGVAQIHGGRAGRGLLLFFLFALTLNAYLVYPLLDDNSGLRMACLALCILFWVISFFDAISHRAPARPAPPAPAPAPIPEAAPHDAR